MDIRITISQENYRVDDRVVVPYLNVGGLHTKYERNCELFTESLNPILAVHQI